jgi:hypothetical protein
MGTPFFKKSEKLLEKYLDVISSCPTKTSHCPIQSMSAPSE